MIERCLFCDTLKQEDVMNIKRIEPGEYNKRTSGAQGAINAFPEEVVMNE